MSENIVINAEFGDFNFQADGEPPEVHYGMIEFYWPEPDDQLEQFCNIRPERLGKRVKITIEILD